MRWLLPFAVAALAVGATGCFTLAKRGLVELEQRKQRSRNLQLPPDCNPTELSPLPEGQRPTLAVIDMDAGARLAPDSSRAMADLCRAVVHDSGQYELIDREHVVDILGEQDFAAAVQCDSTKCLVQYGRMLGVQKMMTGRLTKLGNSIVVYLAIADANTGSIDTNETFTLPDDGDALAANIPKAACALLRKAHAGG